MLFQEVVANSGLNGQNSSPVADSRVFRAGFLVCLISFSEVEKKEGVGVEQ